jgi:hypothetical protein
MYVCVRGGPRFIRPLHCDLQDLLCLTQAGSLRPSCAAALIRSQDRSSGIFGEQSGAGAGFLRALRFLLPVLFPPNYALILLQGPPRSYKMGIGSPWQGQMVLGPTQLAANGNPGLLSQEFGRSVNLTTHLNVVPVLGMLDVYFRSPTRHNGTVLN